jgi:hypothetical protein
MSTARKFVKAAAPAPAPAPPVEEHEEHEEYEEEASVEEEVIEVSEDATEESAGTSEDVELSPAEMLMARIDAIEELLAALKKDARKALKGKLHTKRVSNRPKGETPAQVAAWNEFVSATHALMKSEGWPEFKAKNGTLFAAAEQNEESGAWVFSDSQRVPAYKDALAYAGFRKQNGEYVDAGAEEREAEKAAKAAEREAEKAAKKAKREAEKAEREAEREAEKAAKKAERDEAREAEKQRKLAAKQAATKLASKAAVLTKPAAKPAAAKPAAAAPAKPAAKPAATAAPAKPAAAPAPANPANGGAGKSPAAAAKPAAPAPAADDDEIRPWTFKGKKYLRTGAGECWLMNADGSQGKWAGLYDPTTDTIDASAEEPVCEFE